MARDYIPVVGGTDSDRAAADRLRAAPDREKPKQVRQTKVMYTYTVCPDEDGIGGNSRFKVAHGLPGIPDFTYAYVTAINGTGADSVENASVIVAPACAPIFATGAPAAVVGRGGRVADATYSYFMIGLARMSWEGDVTMDGGTGQASIIFSTKWGVPRFAHLQPHTIAGGGGSGTIPGWDISAQTVNFEALSGINFGENFHVQVDFGLMPGTHITVECVSEIREVYDRKIIATSARAMPVP